MQSSYGTPWFDNSALDLYTYLGDKSQFELVAEEKKSLKWKMYILINLGYVSWKML
jgi:hypothetical protein